MVRPTVEALRAYFPDGGFARRIQPLPEQQCVYIKNAKVGTSTVMLWLHRMHTRDHQWTPSVNVHREHGLPTPQSLGLEQVSKMLSGDAYVFSFVRDPLVRAESAYLDKIANLERRPRWRHEVQRVLGLPEDSDEAPSFEMFVAALEAQEPITMDAHWRPQHLNLMHGLVRMDFVGRLETFERDVERVRVEAGLPVVPLAVRNARTSGYGLCDGRPDLVERLRRVYDRDFELYGYPTQ